MLTIRPLGGQVLLSTFTLLLLFLISGLIGLMSELDWLPTWSTQWSLSFLILKFSSLLIILALSYWKQCLSSLEFSAILGFWSSPFVVFHWCTCILVCLSILYIISHIHMECCRCSPFILVVSLVVCLCMSLQQNSSPI